jgi:hypothetical protein
MCEIIMSKVVKTVSVKLLGEGLGLTQEALDESLPKRRRTFITRIFTFTTLCRSPKMALG